MWIETGGNSIQSTAKKCFTAHGEKNTMSDLPDKSLLRVVENAVKKYMDKYLEGHIRNQVNERVNSFLDHGSYAKKIREQVDSISQDLLSGRLDGHFVNQIRKYSAPKIIYVHEPTAPPPQLEPMGVREYFLAPISPCIYFLCLDDRIVYIGQTINLQGRLTAHVLEKNFDRIFFFECAAEDLNTVEATLIEYYDPEYNRAGKKDDRILNERQRR
jgi:hypothetical protein